MAETNDIVLLREYLDRNSETAFSGLVSQHVNLVYSVALRYTGNSQDAQDVTQVVFVILAKKAAGLQKRTNLTGWLYETTRFTSSQLLRTRTRQQAREQEAYVQSTLNDSNSENVWRQLSPLLEEAMARLSEKERTLVALRFFENKSAAETAALLGIQEWAAHKRAARAMEKLRRFFVKRGIASTTTTLAGAISANSVQAAPTMLAKAVTATALAKGATASISTLTLIKGALKVMAWSKAKTAIVVGVVAILAAGTTTTALVIRHQHQSASSSAASRIGTNPGDFAPDKVSFMNSMRAIKMPVFMAFVNYAQAHQDEIPTSMADLQPYLPADIAGLDDDHWEILATGKLTPLLKRGDVVLLQQKYVPKGQFANLKIIGYTDGHFEGRK